MVWCDYWAVPVSLSLSPLPLSNSGTSFADGVQALRLLNMYLSTCLTGILLSRRPRAETPPAEVNKYETGGVDVEYMDGVLRGIHIDIMAWQTTSCEVD